MKRVFLTCYEYPDLTNALAIRMATAARQLVVEAGLDNDDELVQAVVGAAHLILAGNIASNLVGGNAAQALEAVVMDDCHPLDHDRDGYPITHGRGGPLSRAEAQKFTAQIAAERSVRAMQSEGVSEPIVPCLCVQDAYCYGGCPK